MVLVGSSMDSDIFMGHTRQYEYISYEEHSRILELADVKGLTLAQQVFNCFRNGNWKRQNYYRPTEEEMARTAIFEWVHDPDYRSAICQDISRLKLENVPLVLGVPTLVIEGSCDLTWGEEKSELMSEMLPEAEVVVIEDSGHRVWNDSPDIFFDQLKVFVENLTDTM